MAEREPPEKSIFLAAIEIESAAERAVFLDQACADNPKLRNEVEALLIAHDTPPEFLGSRADVPQSIDAPAAQERPGVDIGPYRLLGQIGEGGMGTVFLAEQTVPIRRKVALKIIKPGMDSAQVLARFEAERQALAMMDHVNIARVLDAGATEAGRPYFVMELVDGVPITQYCDDNQLTPRERLELFVPVCHAIQHAHQKGIIHRDVKPSNVMISMYDGQPIAKVIDFGVAKATEQKLISGTEVTQFGTLVGTPEYMSPEQAEMAASGVDTKSDIFSLGVLLYELLTGSTPLTHQRLKEAAYGEILRLVKEEEPPKPSTRLSESGEALESISARRKTDPSKLTKLVRGELDWIVMKCLEKDRNRRYVTANDLATDLQRYLADEPVQACPPSTGYRMRKFVRRHRGPVLVASAFAVLLLVGIVTTTWQAWRATRAEQQARDNEQQAIAQKDKAQANFQLAKEAVDKYLNEVTENPKLNEHDFHQLRKELLETAVPFYRKFAEERGHDAESEAARGRAYRRLATVRDVLGEKENALADFQAMLAIFAKLVVEHPEVPSHHFQLAQCYNNIANIQKQLKKVDDAETAFRESLRIKRRLTEEWPDEPQYQWALASGHNNLGLNLKDQGRLEEAEAAFRTAIRIQEQLIPSFRDDPARRSQLANSHNSLGILFNAQGRFEEAEKSLRASILQFQPLVTEFPKVARYRSLLATSYNNLASALQSQRKYPEAETANRDALTLYAALVADFPSVPEYLQDLGRSHHNLGRLLKDMYRHDEAKASFQAAIKVREQLVTDSPGTATYIVELANAYRSLSVLIRKQGEPQVALDWSTKGIAALEPVLNTAPKLLNVRNLLLRTYWDRAESLDLLHRYADAAKDWDRAVELADGPNKAKFEDRKRQSLRLSVR